MTWSEDYCKYYRDEKHATDSAKLKWRAHKKYCPLHKGDMIRIRCPFTGVWIMKESDWVTL